MLLIYRMQLNEVLLLLRILQNIFYRSVRCLLYTQFTPPLLWNRVLLVLIRTIYHILDWSSSKIYGFLWRISYYSVLFHFILIIYYLYSMYLYLLQSCKGGLSHPHSNILEPFHYNHPLIILKFIIILKKYEYKC